MKLPHTQSGFSLVETLVAITILLLVMVGPMTISSSAAKSTSFSSEQVTAFFLAQEGAELVQKARDDLQLPYFAVPSTNPDPWADFTRTTIGGLYRSCFTNINANGCGLSINTDTAGTIINPINCTTLSLCKMYLNITAGSIRSRYIHSSANAAITPFTRRIYLSNINANEVRVVSRVTWRTGSLKTEQTAEVETRLFNTYGN
jgi:prepilin-type N-terminal cleavage/methylation domain-containing protein